MVRKNIRDVDQTIISKHWLKRIYIIEAVCASLLALGCIWVFAQALSF